MSIRPSFSQQDNGPIGIDLLSDIIPDSIEIPNHHPFPTIGYTNMNSTLEGKNAVSPRPQAVSLFVRKENPSKIESILGHSPISTNFAGEDQRRLMNQSMIDKKANHSMTFTNNYHNTSYQQGQFELSGYSEVAPFQANSNIKKQGDPLKPYGNQILGQLPNHNKQQGSVTTNTSAQSAQKDVLIRQAHPQIALNPRQSLKSNHSNSKHQPRQSKLEHRKSGLFDRIQINHAEAVPSILQGLNTRMQALVIRASKKLLKTSETHRFNQLSEEGFRLINDQAYFTKIQLLKQQSSAMRRIRQCFSSIRKCFYHCGMVFWRFWRWIPLIDPNSTYLKYWDILSVMCICLNMFYLMIEYVLTMSFIEYYGWGWYIVIIFSLVIFSIDIFLNFHKGIYEKGVLIAKKNHIARRYLGSDLILDLCALVPLYLSITQTSGTIRVLTVLILLQIKRANRIMAKSKDLYASRVETKSLGYTITMVKLIMTILFAAHIFATFFLGIANLVADEAPSYTTWVSKMSLVSEAWQVQYIYALYWAVVTMTTVGYGDITPQNPYEVCFVIVAMFISCGFFAYTFNSIGSMVQEMAQSSREFDDWMKMVNLYLESNNLATGLKMKIRKYFEYQRDRTKTVTKKQEEEILSSIDDELREELLNQIGIEKYKRLRELTPLFEEFSEGVQRQIYDISEELHIRSEDSQHFIVDASKNDNYDFYIITKGKAHIYMKGASYGNLNEDDEQNDSEARKRNLDANQQKQNVHRILVSLGKHDIFGQTSFFTNEERSFSVRCEKNTVLLRFSQKQFMEILKKNPNDFQIFCQMRDQMKLERDFSKMNLTCYICKEIGHDLSKCNSLHYEIKRDQFFSRENAVDAHKSKTYRQPNFRPQLWYFERRKTKKSCWQYMLFNHALMVAGAPKITPTPQPVIEIDQTNNNATAPQNGAGFSAVSPANNGKADVSPNRQKMDNAVTPTNAATNTAAITTATTLVPQIKLDPIANAKAMNMKKDPALDDFELASIDFLRSFAIQTVAGSQPIQELLKVVSETKRDTREGITIDDSDARFDYTHYFASFNYPSQQWKMILAKIKEYKRLGIPFDRREMSRSVTIKESHPEMSDADFLPKKFKHKQEEEEKPKKQGGFFFKFMNLMDN